MSVKIFGKRFLKSVVEKERDKLRNRYSQIADLFEEYCIENPEDAYTESLQNEQQAISERLDLIGWSNEPGYKFKSTPPPSP